MLLGAAAVHEGGHLLVLRSFGASAGSFSLSPTGAVIRTADLPLSYFREILCVLAGPGANLIVGILLGVLADVWPDAVAFAGAHWVLGFFNLLPAAPLDGWRAIQLLLCWRLGPGPGHRFGGMIGGAFAFLLTGWILALMLFSGGNLWLLPAAAGTAVSGLRAAKSGGYV